MRGNHGLVVVSVVVVVTGLRTVVSCDVVVVRWLAEPLSLLQADNDKRAAMARLERTSFFILGSLFGLFLFNTKIWDCRSTAYGV